MDLLCTEKIMSDYETDIMYHHHHHPTETLEQNVVEVQTSALNGGVIVTTNSPTESSLSQLSYALSMSENSSSSASVSSASYGEYQEMSIIQSQHNSSSKRNSTSMSQPQSESQSQQIQTQPVEDYTTSMVASDGGCSSGCSDGGVGGAAVELMEVVMSTSGNKVHIAAQPNHQSQQQQQEYSHVPLRRPVEILNTATEDPTFLTDRCLETALKIDERRQRPLGSYFKTVQSDITPPMRKLVAEWMMEVSPIKQL